MEQDVLVRKANEIDPQVGNRIRIRRKSIGMSQAELATSIGVSFQQIQKYEKGINAVAERRLQQICDVMKLPRDYFTSGHTAVGLAAKGTESTADEPTQEDMQRFLATPEGTRLVKAFTSVGDAQLRTRILDFISAIASDRRK